MYDYVFITHLPAFYKNNLYNEISKTKKIFVIYISQSSTIRTSDFTSFNFNYRYKFINSKPFEERNFVSSCLKLVKLLKSLECKKMVLGGWDLPEFWCASYIKRKIDNCVVVESSVYESTTVGLKSIIKKIFLYRIATAFASGVPQVELLKGLGFKGQIVKCHGVGIPKFPSKLPRNHLVLQQKTYVYVGRLSEEKNVSLLIDYFSSQMNRKLIVIGDGPLRKALESQCSQENITFLGSIKNELLGEVLQTVTAMILPSFSEAWGLVVEEALYYDLPVICSNKVGSSYDLVLNKTGLTFDPTDIGDLSRKIETLEQNYSSYKQKAVDFDIENRAKMQIASFIDFNEQTL